MFVCFIDEAGVPELRTNQPDDVFVIAGLVLPVSNWARLDAEIETLKSKYGLAPDTEIHAAILEGTYADQESLVGFESMSHAARRSAVESNWRLELKRAKQEGLDPKRIERQHRQQRPYAHLTRPERLRLLEDACDSLTNADVTLLAKALDTGLYSNGETTLAHALLQLICGFQSHLEREWGIMVLDVCNRPGYARGLVKLHQDAAVLKPTRPSTICGTPLFVESTRTNMIGLADLVAYSVRRCLIGKDDRLFARIESLLRYPTHFSKRDPCGCRICAEDGL